MDSPDLCPLVSPNQLSHDPQNNLMAQKIVLCYNRIYCSHRQCNLHLYYWGFLSCLSRPCRAQEHTARPLVMDCSLYHLDGGWLPLMSPNAAAMIEQQHHSHYIKGVVCSGRSHVPEKLSSVMERQNSHLISTDTRLQVAVVCVNGVTHS